MDNKLAVLIIRDGWGVCKPGKYNAVCTAATPNVSSYLKKYPVSVLEASGEAFAHPSLHE